MPKLAGGLYIGLLGLSQPSTSVNFLGSHWSLGQEDKFESKRLKLGQDFWIYRALKQFVPLVDLNTPRIK